MTSCSRSLECGVEVGVGNEVGEFGERERALSECPEDEVLGEN
jgi:hypothetical protein